MLEVKQVEIEIEKLISICIIMIMSVTYYNRLQLPNNLVEWLNLIYKESSNKSVIINENIINYTILKMIQIIILNYFEKPINYYIKYFSKFKIINIHL